jgi:transcription elongation factor Elf1
MKKRRKKKRKPDTAQEASYICDACGEEIVVPVDVSAGESQEYVEDCPVCCRPNVIHVEFHDDGDVHVWGEAE